MRIDAPTTEQRVDEPSLRVQLAGHDLRRTSLRRWPAMSAHALLRDAAADRNNGLDIRLRGMVLSALSSEQRLAYSVLSGPEGTFCPTFAIPHGYEWSLADIDSARCAADLERELQEAFQDAIPVRWLRVLDELDDWITAMSSGLRSSRRLVFDQLWRQLRDRLDLETWRFETAMEANALPAFYNGLSSGLRMDSDELQMRWAAEIFIEFPGDLVLAPIAGPGHLLLDHGPDMCSAYPMSIDGSPDPRAGNRGTERIAAHRLQALVGPTREQILVALRRRATLGTISDQLNVAPSTMTHHISVLKASGLVVTHKRGKHVWASLTNEGHLLLDLLGSN